MQATLDQPDVPSADLIAPGADRRWQIKSADKFAGEPCAEHPGATKKTTGCEPTNPTPPNVPSQRRKIGQSISKPGESAYAPGNDVVYPAARNVEVPPLEAGQIYLVRYSTDPVGKNDPGYYAYAGRHLDDVINATHAYASKAGGVRKGYLVIGRHSPDEEWEYDVEQEADGIEVNATLGTNEAPIDVVVNLETGEVDDGEKTGNEQGKTEPTPPSVPDRESSQARVEISKNTKKEFYTRFAVGSELFRFEAAKEVGDVEWGIGFVAGDRFTTDYSLTKNRSVSPIAVFSRVGESIRLFIREKNPQSFAFTASVEEGRVSLYDRFSDRIGTETGYEKSTFLDDGGKVKVYVFRKNETGSATTGAKHIDPANWFNKSGTSASPSQANDPIKVHLPDLEQSANYTCGASCLLSISEYYGVGAQDEISFASALGSDSQNGTPPDRILDYAAKLGLSVRSGNELTLDDVRRELDARRPVLVLIQAWDTSAEREDDYARNEAGHYVVLVGYDDARVYFEDPMLKGTRGELPHAEFLERWHDQDAAGKRYVRWGASFWRQEHATYVKSADKPHAGEPCKPGWTEARDGCEPAGQTEPKPPRVPSQASDAKQHGVSADDGVAAGTVERVASVRDLLTARFGKLGSVIRIELKNTNDARQLQSAVDSETFGYYDKLRDVVVVAAGSVAAMQEQFAVTGGTVVDPSIEGVLRHETGHAAYQKIGGYQRAEWEGIHAGLPDDFYLSSVASQSPEEFFCEAFSYYTSPDYETRVLPEAVDSFLRGLQKTKEKPAAPQVPARETPLIPQEDWKRNGVRSAAFKAWFGDSKVVDDKGDPLVVYHGSPESFESFDIEGTTDLGIERAGAAFFSASPETAGSYAYHESRAVKQVQAKLNKLRDARDARYAELADKAGELHPPNSENGRVRWLGDMLDEGKVSREEYDGYFQLEDQISDVKQELSAIGEADTSPNVMPVYLSIKNPKVVDANKMGWQYIVPEHMATVDRGKYDGIIFKNVRDSGDESEIVTTTYVVFNPTQVKSAYNAGIFDPSSANINKALPAAETKALGPHKYGCVMAVLPQPLRKTMTDWSLETVAECHLAPEGFELRPHVTVKYGLNGKYEDDLPRLAALLTAFGPFKVKLADRLSLFTGGKDGTVLKIDVEGDRLRQLNAIVTGQFDCHDKYPEYRPHCTLAYLAPNEDVGDYYAAMRAPFLGAEFIVDAVEFSGPDGERAELPLTVTGNRVDAFTQLLASGKALNEKRHQQLPADAPDLSRPNRTKPHPTSPDPTAPNRARPDRARPDRTARYSNCIEPTVDSKTLSWLGETAGGALVKPPARETPNETKPANCTCRWPEVRNRNGSGHANDCPCHKEWLDAGGFKQHRDVGVKELRARYRPKHLTGAGKSLNVQTKSTDPTPPSVPGEGSYFASCERDDAGHCLPKGETGAHSEENEAHENAEAVSINTLADKLPLNEYGRKGGAVDLGPIRVRAYRVGPVEDTAMRGGVFFAGDEQGAESYRSLHPSYKVEAYVVDLANALLAGHQNDLTKLFFKKTYGDMLDSFIARNRGKPARVAQAAFDKKINAEAKKRGYDGIIYLSPAPPAKTEIVVIGKPGKRVASSGKKSLTWATKDLCKPGERADLTHCTPKEKPSGPTPPTVPARQNESPLSKLGNLTLDKLKTVGREAGHLEHVAVEWAESKASANVAKLPHAMQAVVRGAWLALRLGTKASFISYTAGQKAAEAISRARGSTPAEAATLKAICSAIDLIAMKPVSMISMAVAGPAVGGLASMVPLGSAGYVVYAGVGSLTYLAASTAIHPVDTIRKAQAAVMAVAGRLRGGKALDPDAEQALRAVADWVGADDYRTALFLAALDEAGDVQAALRLAQEAEQEMGQKALSAWRGKSADKYAGEPCSGHPGATEKATGCKPSHTEPVPPQVAKRTEPQPKTKKVVLWRAADDDIITDVASFSVDREAAEKYTNNPGFGGGNLYRTKVTIDESEFLDLFADSQEEAVAKITELTGLPDPGAIGVDEWVPRIAEDLREAGITWVRVKESYPEDTETYIFLGGDDPEMEEVHNKSLPHFTKSQGQPCKPGEHDTGCAKALPGWGVKSGSHEGEPCEPGWTADRTGCVPQERTDHKPPHVSAHTPKLPKAVINKVSEWREHLWNRGTVARLAKQCVAGGALESYHPGEITVYRGEPAGSKLRLVGGTSWTKSKRKAEQYAEGGRVRELLLSMDTPALDINKVLRGVRSKSEGDKEVFVYFSNPRQKFLPHYTKSQGQPCKQGEHDTGCVKADGTVSGQPRNQSRMPPRPASWGSVEENDAPAPPPPSKPAMTAPPPLSEKATRVHANFKTAIDKTPELSPAQKKRYADGMATALHKMPDVALDRLVTNVKSVKFHDGADGVTYTLLREPSLKDETRAKLQAMANVGSKYQGVYIGGIQKLLLDGTTETAAGAAVGEARYNVHEVYAHELGHAIDGPEHELSGDTEWYEAYLEEVARPEPVARLSSYAQQSKTEAFAEFCRLVYSTDVPQERVEQLLPKCTAYFKAKGLWPVASGSEGAKALPDWNVKASRRPAGPTPPKVSSVDTHRVWIAFEGNQIKSSENAGTFDPKETNINKALSEYDAKSVGAKR